MLEIERIKLSRFEWGAAQSLFTMLTLVRCWILIPAWLRFGLKIICGRAVIAGLRHRLWP